jgi:hypothetical protein
MVKWLSVARVNTIGPSNKNIPATLKMNVVIVNKELFNR